MPFKLSTLVNQLCQAYSNFPAFPLHLLSIYTDDSQADSKQCSSASLRRLLRLSCCLLLPQITRFKFWLIINYMGSQREESERWRRAGRVLKLVLHLPQSRTHVCSGSLPFWGSATRDEDDDDGHKRINKSIACKWDVPKRQPAECTPSTRKHLFVLVLIVIAFPPFKAREGEGAAASALLLSDSLCCCADSKQQQ